MKLKTMQWYTYKRCACSSSRNTFDTLTNALDESMSSETSNTPKRRKSMQ